MSKAKNRFKLGLILLFAVFISFQVYKAWYTSNHKSYARLYITIPETDYEEFRTYLSGLSKNYGYEYEDNSDKFTKWGHKDPGILSREEFTSRYKYSYEDIRTNPKYYEEYIAGNPYVDKPKKTLHIQVFDWKQFGFKVLSIYGSLNKPDSPNAITIETKKTYEKLMPDMQLDFERRWPNSTKLQLLSE